MKPFKFFAFFILLFVIGFRFYSRNSQEMKDAFSSSNSTMQSGQDPKDSIAKYLPTSTTKTIVKHTYFTLSYSEPHEQAEWVAYYIDANTNASARYKRRQFMGDNKVLTGAADIQNYRNSGYDRGHLCAAADMKISKLAYDETFFMSNVAPQKHGFNDGDWRRLEEKTRYWAQKYQGLYVVTGGVLEKGLKTIGSDQVAVPNYFYKILFCKSRGTYKMVGFLMPHKNTNEPLYKYVVSVDAIEKLTKIDFFPQLDDQLEKRLEKESDYKKWAFD
jgi:endonuclease G